MLESIENDIIAGLQKLKPGETMVYGRWTGRRDDTVSPRVFAYAWTLYLAGCISLTQRVHGRPGGDQPRTIDYIATGRKPPFIPILDPDAPPKPKPQPTGRRRGRPAKSGV
jgi:hypothetical protein